MTASDLSSDPAPDPAPRTAPEAVAEGFRRLPDGPAVLDDIVRLSRSELDTASVRIARRAAEAGVAPGAACVVLVPLDADGVVAYLGAVRSGAAVIGLDAGLPVAYLRDVAERTKAEVAVVTGASAALARAAGLRTIEASAIADAADPWDRAECDAAAARLPLPQPDDVAFFSFTSGSTGRPKALAITHAQEHGRATQPAAAPRPAGSRETLLTPFGPSGSRRRVLAAAVEGIVLCALDVRRLGLERLTALIDEHEVRVLRPPVGLFRSMTATLGDRRFRSVTEVYLTGEAIHTADLLAFQRCFRPDALLYCRYGSSEASGGGGQSVALQLRGTDEIPDGPLLYPVLGTGGPVSVERPDGTPADLLEPGEIVCRGAGLVDGYFDDPELTAQRFFVDPDGTRGFRTGDLGRFHPGGRLEILGRNDDQVTVRGNNVHLGTVEAALRRQPGVTDGAVVATRDARGGTKLTAAIVATGDRAPTVGELRLGLARDLPAHMVPQRFFVAETLPRLANGKLDRAAVRSLADGAAPLGLGRADRPPGTPTEQTIAAVFAAVLGLEHVGADDDFFDLGGDSLAAEELVARLAGAYGRRVTRGAVLECPTVAALALRVDDTGRSPDGLVLLHPGGDGEPVFVAPGGGQEPFDLVRLAHRLGADRPVYSYRSLLYERRGRPDRTVEAVAARYVEAYTRRVGHRPRLLAGYSSGAAVALEMAAQLAAAGSPVALFASIDGSAPPPAPRPRRPWRTGPPVGETVARLRSLPRRDLPLGILKATTRRPRAWLADRTLGLVRRDRATQFALLYQAAGIATSRYRGRPFAGPALLVVAGDETTGRRDEQGWTPWLRGSVDRVTVPGDHHSLLREPNVAELADHLAAALQAAALQGADRP